jgi:hypothetical protein
MAKTKISRNKHNGKRIAATHTTGDTVIAAAGRAAIKESETRIGTIKELANFQRRPRIFVSEDARQKMVHGRWWRLTNVVMDDDRPHDKFQTKNYRMRATRQALFV